MTDSDQETRGHGRSPQGTQPNGDRLRRIDRHIAYFGDRIITAARTGTAARRLPSRHRSLPSPE